MRLLGFDIGVMSVSQTPITPIMLHDETLTQRFSRRHASHR